MSEGDVGGAAEADPSCRLRRYSVRSTTIVPRFARCLLPPTFTCALPLDVSEATVNAPSDEDDEEDGLTGFYAWIRSIGLYYGDSGIFVRRCVYEALGEFQPIPAMEDLEFVRRLELTIPDVPDFYSALTNHTGCRRPLAHPPVGRTGVCYFWTPVTRPLVEVASPRAAAESA
jgi:hypothetical protein